MAEDSKQIIFDIKVKYDEAIEKIAKLKIENEKLKDSQKDLQAEIKKGGDNQEKYARQLAVTESEYKYNQKAIQTLSNEIQNNLKIQSSQTGVIEKLKAQLSLTTSEWNKLSEAEQEVKGANYQKYMSDLTSKLKEAEQAHGDFRREVGNYANAGKEMKAQVKELTNALAGMRDQGQQNSAEYAEMNQRLNELKTTLSGTSETTKTLDATTQSVTAAFAAFTAYQAILAQSTEVSDEYLEIMKNMQVALVMLTTWTSISASIQKGSTAYKSAEIVLQKIGINQTVMQAKAEAALNVVKGQGSIVTKAVAASQWLWNAALSANPVVLVAMAVIALIAGVTALIKVFDSSAKAQKEAEKASKDYEEQQRKTKEAIADLNDSEKNASNERNNRLREEILELKKNGASSIEIERAKAKAAQDTRDVQIATSRERIIQQQDEQKAMEKSLQAEQKLLAIYLEKKGEQSKKYQEQKKVVDELTASLNRLKQAHTDEIQIQDDLILASKESAQNLKEQEDNDAKKRAQDAATAAKDRQEKQREAIRKAEDSALAIVKDSAEKQRKAINQNYDRQIEDLNIKLATEKNLTETARQALNQSIINLEKKRNQDLSKLDDDIINQQIEKEQKRIELQLEVVKKGTEEEYNLKLESIENQRKYEIEANRQLSEDKRQDEALINAKYDKKRLDEIDNMNKTIRDKQKESLELEMKERLSGVEDGSIQEAQIKYEYAKNTYDDLVKLGEDAGAAQMGSVEAYKNAVLNANKEMKNSYSDVLKAVAKVSEMQLQAAAAVGQSFEDLFNALAENNESMAGFAKAMAIFNIGISLAEGLAKAASSGTVLQIALSVAAVIAAIAKAYSVLNQQKQPKAPKFATGGLVTGAGSGTSDSIPAQLSNGESIMTAQTTSMFAPLLSSLNQIGGGIPINVVETSQQIMGEEMLTSSFAKALINLPNPVVSVEEINNTNTRVQVLENLRVQ